MPVLTTKKGVYFILGLIALSMGLCWKPLTIIIWRLSHQESATVNGRRVEIPFPWMLIGSGDSAKIETFSSLLPTWHDEYATVLIEPMPLNQRKQTDGEWIDLREEIYASNGFNDVHEKSSAGGAVLCSEASKGHTLFAYCKSKADLSLVYTGPARLVGSGIKLLPIQR